VYLSLLTASLDACLSYRIQQNHTRDHQTRIVTKVERLEPLALRMEWMKDLAQAVSFLESLNLAHGDLRPENVLLDRNRLKLTDFDCTAEIGSYFEACISPYGRILNSNETDQGQTGSAGFLGPRTEQFALGSLYYLINYGVEVYGDQCLTDDPKDHGPKVLDLLQNLEFPHLDTEPHIDDVISKCWHNKYVTIAELARHTEMLFTEGTDSKVLSTTSRTDDETINNGQSSGTANKEQTVEEFSSKREFCEDLGRRGLLQLLSSSEPRELGFTEFMFGKF
jgi:serine/threonine protein kinase